MTTGDNLADRAARMEALEDAADELFADADADADELPSSPHTPTDAECETLYLGAYHDSEFGVRSSNR